MSDDSSAALSYPPIFDGNCPVTMLNREGAHSGELQYADSKTTPSDANRSRLGVLIAESLLYIFSKGADIWSAIIYRMFGRGSAILSPIISQGLLIQVTCKVDE